MYAVLFTLSRFLSPSPEGMFCSEPRPLATDYRQTVRECVVCQKGDPLCPFSVLSPITRTSEVTR